MSKGIHHKIDNNPSSHLRRTDLGQSFLAETFKSKMVNFDGT